MFVGTCCSAPRTEFRGLPCTYRITTLVQANRWLAATYHEGSFLRRVNEQRETVYP